MLNNLRRSLPEDCLSDLAFDQWRAGEFDAVREEQAYRHLASCSRCTQRREALIEEAQGFLAQYPRLPLAAGHLNPTRTRRSLAARGRGSRARAYALVAASLALAAGVLLFIGARRGAEGDPWSATTRPKGGARLGFYVKRAERVFRGSDGERLRQGDQLRFVVTNAALRHVAILSRDGAGVASIYYPPEPRSRALAEDTETALDAAVKLDATPGQERVFGIFCAAEFELEPLRRTLEKNGRLPSIPGCTIDELNLQKEPL
jgi:hypothetical protein